MMQKHPAITLERVERFLLNLYRSAVNHSAGPSGAAYGPRSSAAVRLARFSPKAIRPTFERASRGPFTPVAVGDVVGPSWSSHWYQVTITIPSSEDWAGQEVHLIWDSGCEALVFSKEGYPLQGLTGGDGHDKRHEFILSESSTPGQEIELFVEVACNGMFGVGEGGMIRPPNPSRTFTLAQAEIAVVKHVGQGLLRSVTALYDIARLQPESTLGRQCLYAANQVVNVFDKDDEATWAAALEIAREPLAHKGGSDVTRGVVHAVGHCHIDTAWLWPFDETRRKVVRSWATASTYMKYARHEGYAFTASQAQQLEWLSKDAPQLYDQLKLDAKAGGFVPVGGSWVEMDANVPCGESIVRQLLYGQRFFQKEFGEKSQVFWLPDTFGYAAQFPQIIKSAGMPYFMTQKLSWSLINKFPHSSFQWRGLDGTEVLTHFPPADTYNSQVSVEEVSKSITNNKDVDRAPVSLMLFGNGDGGGGPTLDMLARVNTLGDIDGLPKLIHSHPVAFFKELEAWDAKRPLCVWDGELYLELHQGTFTTQANEKKLNRLCEVALHALEVAAVELVLSGVDIDDATAAPDLKFPWGSVCAAGMGSPVTTRGACSCDVATIPLRAALHPTHIRKHFWEDLLLCQFHDVLPGSSIGMVHRDAHIIRQRVLEHALVLLSRVHRARLAGVEASHFTGPLTGVGTTTPLRADAAISAWNSCSVSRAEFVAVPASAPLLQETWDGKGLMYLTAAPYGQCDIVSDFKPLSSIGAVTAETADGSITLANDLLRVTIDTTDGSISRCVYLPLDREVTTGAAGVFITYQDVPFYWDAWDIMPYALETGKSGLSAVTVTLLESGPCRAVVCVESALGKSSSLRQLITLSAGSPQLNFECTVDWRESHVLLKVEFPVDIRATEASFETQFGFVKRPTTTNTSWEVAKYEVCGHRFADLSESGFGVALLNDSKYGYCCRNSTLALSLLRSPKAPDDTCDMGTHTFRFALLPHEDAFPVRSVVEAGIAFNSPMTIHSLRAPAPSAAPLFSVTSPSRGCMPVLDTVKWSEDDDGVIIVRLYEALGGRAKCTLASRHTILSASAVNVLEEADATAPGAPVTLDPHTLQFACVPFGIVSLRVQLASE